jgi:hypothetical protein
MKKVLGILLGLMLCLSGVFAEQILPTDNLIKVPSPVVIEKIPVNINGLSGEIDMMSTSGSSETLTPHLISSNGVSVNDNYAGVQGGKRWLFDNAKADKDDYRVNSQTGKVERKVEFTENSKCPTKKVRWMSQLSNYLLNQLFNKTRAEVKANDVRLDKKTYSNVCIENRERWEVVDTSKPSE